MKFGDSLPKRRAQIKQLSGTTSPKTFPVDFQSERSYLRVYSVSIDFPRYRLANGRTGVEQLEYLSKHPNLAKDLFEKPESDLAQQHQHNILREMIDVADLRVYFKNNKQLDPLILDSEGFVINGNRRLCAMREYYYSKQKDKFKHFRNIDVVFLPPSDQKAILELENKLQIQKDIKAGYRWYNTAYMFKRRLAEKMDSKEVQRMYDLSTKELNHQLAMFEEAERYLQVQKKPGQFSIIPESKYAFDEVVKALKVVGEEKKDAFLPLAYLVIEKADGQRAYGQIPKIARDLDKILRLVPTTSKTVKTAPKSANKSGLSLLGSKPSKQKTSKILIPKLDSTKTRDAAREAILDTIGAQDALRRENKKGGFVKAQLEKADQCLQSALADLKTTNEKAKLPSVLTRIEQTVAKLRRAIGR